MKEMLKLGLVLACFAAVACVALAFVTMFFVKHGDSKPNAPQDKFEALAGADD